MHHRPTTTTTVVRVIFQLGVFGAVAAAAINYQYFLDQYALATFHPSADVAGIEDRLQLTPQAKALFARSQPVIDAKSQFNSDCQTTKGELELGCYYRGHIYVLKIDNASLVSEMDVVMAHELLHAAWLRLKPADQKVLSAQLESTYAAMADSDLRDRMAEYAKTEPGEEANELHSILGTERTGVSASLETYYGRYFDARPKIVAAHAAYQSVFDDRRSELEGQLASIRTLKAQLSSLNAQLASLKTSGNISGYNALVPRQNRLVDNINTRITAYQAGVDEYNALSRSLDSQQITDTETGVSQ